jgi:hypothetical protein
MPVDTPDDIALKKQILSYTNAGSLKYMIQCSVGFATMKPVRDRLKNFLPAGFK